MLEVVFGLLSIATFFWGRHEGSKRARESDKKLDQILEEIQKSGRADVIRDPVTARVERLKWHDLEADVVFAKSEVSTPTLDRGKSEPDG